VKKKWTSRWLIGWTVLSLVLAAGSSAAAKDNNPPKVTAIPHQGQTDVSVLTEIQLKFNESVKLAAGGSISSKNGGTLAQVKEAASLREVPCEARWSPSKRTLTLKPAAPLAYGTDYLLTMSAGMVADGAGNKNEALTVRWRTETKLPPFAVTFFPADQAVGVPQETLIALTFNKPMWLSRKQEITAKSVETFVKLTDEKNRRVSYSAKWDGQSRTVTLDPVGNLQGGSSYTVTLAGNKLTDSQGNKNPQLSSTFTTRKPLDVIPPNAIILPAHGAKRVPLEAKITVQFAEEVVRMDGSSLSSKTAGDLIEVLDQTGVPVARTVTWNKSKRTLTVKPKGKWEKFTTYHVLVPAGGVKDIAGNPNPAQLSSFTTGDR
jgi:hypothetical protein